MHRALIVAHGQPGEPAPQQAAVEALAARVAGHLPDARVQGATLAMPGALAAADDATLIYPLFMATGWFTRMDQGNRIVRTAVKYEGAPYRYGGSTPGG